MADDGISTKISVLGDKEYKASLSDIGRQLTLLNTGMSASQSAFAGQGDSMESVKAKGKSLEAIYATQADKVKLIAEQLGKAKEEYGDNSKQAQNLEIALNRATTTMNKAGQEIQDNDAKLGKMGDATDEAAKGQDGLEKSTDKAADAVKDEGKEAGSAEKENSKLGDALKKTGEIAGAALVIGVKAAAAAMTAMAAAAGAAVVAGFNMAKGAGVYADDLLTLSSVTGMSTDTLQEWTYAANFVDTELSVVTKSMARMTKAVGDAAGGNKTAQKKFKDLGVSIYDAGGKLRDSEVIFMDAIDALGKIENATERDAAAMDLFGKSALELNPLIETGSEGLKKYKDEAHDMGVVFSGEALDAMGSFDDSMQTLNATSEALKNTIGLTLIPAFQPLVDTAATTMAEVTKLLQDGVQEGDMESITTLLTDAVSTGLDSIETLVTDSLPIVSGLLSTLVTDVVAAIPDFITQLLPAATALLQSIMDSISENSAPLLEAATAVITAIGGFLVDNIPLLVDTATSLITDFVKYITDNVSLLVDGATKIMTGLIDAITALLPDLIPLAVDLIVKLAVALVDALPKLIEKMPEIWAAIIEGFKGIDWVGLASDMIQGLSDGLSAAVESYIAAIKETFGKIWDAIKGVFGIASPSTLAAEAGGFILDGLLAGFSGAIDAVVTKVKEIFGKIWDAIKSIFGFGGESAESKDAKAAGKNIMTGMQKGIEENNGSLDNAVKDVAKKVLKTLRNTMGIADGADKSTESEKYGKWIGWGIDYGLKAITEADFKGGAGQVLSAVTGSLNAAFGVAGTGFIGTGGLSAKKFEDIGKAVNKAIADGIKASTDNAKEVKDALIYVAQAAYDQAMAEMETGITNSSETVNAAVKACAEAANEAAAAILTSELGGKTAKPWVDGIELSMTAAVGKKFGENIAKGIAIGILAQSYNTTEAGKTLTTAIRGAMMLVVGIGGSGFVSVGEAIADGVAKGINNGSSKIASAARSAAQSAYNAAKVALGIRSPSRVMMEIGEQFDAGFSSGIDKGMNKVLQSARNLSMKTAREMSGGSGRQDSNLDYDRLGEAVARANIRSGAFNQQIIMDGQLVGQTVEPSVSRESYKRAQQSIAGRSARLALV